MLTLYCPTLTFRIVEMSITGFNPLDTMDISLNKQKLMYNILTASIISIYKFLWTYGGSGHIYIYIYARGLLRVNLLQPELSKKGIYN